MRYAWNPARREKARSIGIGGILSAAGPVPGSGSRARLPVRSPPLWDRSPLTRPVSGSRATRSPVPPAALAGRCHLLAQISRERKLQIARASIAAIQATAQITYAAGGGSAEKNGFAATAGPSCD